ncbi:TonB-dependent receptor plug domain-containing protein [Aequorivita echinoideorum]|uniref:TonB-dependent receptor n=1 Tax=Aequorivita echinoideorum TaxID=1549647 RepID=A0ABS5S2F5_9FLAO|nr:TonB-dependent receptor [Aequorivita echinoideorum]MBT0607359.1 TonB-dependent receptor [Aequorivita echinoideorum]
MKHLVTIFLLFGGFTGLLNAQTDPVTALDDVYLTPFKIQDSAYTVTATVLKDSVLKRNQASLTNLLTFNTPIYFKENGLGMVSSPSFRGTTASQTAVLWNGININSQTTGQTDFNTINTRGYNKIEVKPGGSVVDGSGAIGGSIHLENELNYNKGFSNQLFMNYGEFNTYGVDYRTTYSSENLSVMLGVARNGSDNDYPFPERERKNVNGQYQNTNVAFAAGSKLNLKNKLNFYANVYDGRRNFSVPTPNALKTKYTDFNTRALVEWESIWGSFASNLKVASTTEEYNYFANIDSDFFTFGTVESVIAKYSLDYSISKKMLLSAGGNFTRNSGEGSDISSETRNLAAALLGFKHFISKSFLYEITLRQETNENYGNPLLYSAGISAEVTDFYQLKLNTSKNFRIPTFNDLYWTGLGNPDLKPETSYQGEVSNKFHINNASLLVTGYYNTVTDLLRYIPGNDGIFRPKNTNEVEIYGIESVLSANKDFGKHKLNATATYAYTVSENKETGNQLTYVPFHKFTASVGYGVGNFSAYYQHLQNGKVYTSTDNSEENILNSYMTANLGAEYSFGKRKRYMLGVQALNLWNAAYQSALNRPMPGRNFNFYINLIF